MLPFSGFGFDEEEDISQEIGKIIIKFNNRKMEHRHYTLQNTGMPNRTAHHIPNHVIPNSEIGYTNAIIHPSQIPKNIAHEQHSHTFPNTFNNQLITSNEIHEAVSVPASAMTMNDIDVPFDKILQNYEVASIEQLVPNLPQTSMELNSNVSEEDLTSMSAPEDSRFTNKHNTDIKNIEICYCIPKCSDISSCNNKIIYDSNGKRIFMCSMKECNKLFDRRSYLIRHMRSHTGEKPYVCTKCNKRFSQPSSRDRHNRAQHIDAPAMTTNDTDVPCNKVLQNYEVASIEQLVSNQPQTSMELNSNVSEEDLTSMSAPEDSRFTNKHNTDIKNIEICYCIPKCSDISSCNNKIIYDSNGKQKFMCFIKECKKLFDRKSHLIRHERSHTGEKPYVCTKCDKRFSQTSSLDRHNRAQHIDGKIHTCTICFRKFARKCHVKNHEKRLHNNK